MKKESKSFDESEPRFIHLHPANRDSPNVGSFIVVNLPTTTRNRSIGMKISSNNCERELRVLKLVTAL